MATRRRSSTWRLETTCATTTNPEALAVMAEKKREISRRTLYRRVGVPTLARTFLFYAWGRKEGLRLAGDPYVDFFRSTWQGRPCYVVVWSMIDHIFTQEDYGTG